MVLCPAMNTAMWDHPLTAKQLSAIKEEFPWPCVVVPPVEKTLMCGVVGNGAMNTPTEIAQQTLLAMMMTTQTHSNTTATVAAVAVAFIFAILAIIVIFTLVLILLLLLLTVLTLVFSLLHFLLSLYTTFSTAAARPFRWLWHPQRCQ